MEQTPKNNDMVKIMPEYGIDDEFIGKVGRVVEVCDDADFVAVEMPEGTECAYDDRIECFPISMVEIVA